MYIILALAIISFINAYDLTSSAYALKASGTGNFYCDINSLFSCSSVFSENFARIFWIPFSEIAMVVYPIIAIIAIIALIKKCKWVYKVLLGLAIGGMIFNGYIIVNEFIVWVFCPSCLACTGAILTIGILSFLWMKENA